MPAKASRPKAADIPLLDHADGCPGARVESYTARRPDGAPVRVVRCADCGGHTAATTQETEQEAPRG